MRPHSLFLGWCLLLVPAAALAQTVRGTVVEDSSRAPIVGATVRLDGPGGRTASAETDSMGSFVVKPGRGGEWTVRLGHPSYAPVTVELRVERETFIELRMGRTAIPLEPLVVAARGTARTSGFYERMQQAGFGKFIDQEEIELRAGLIRTTDLLRTLPGVEIVPVKRGGSNEPPPPGPIQETIQTTSLIYLRGGLGGCLPHIFLDGMPIQQTMDSSIDEFLRPEMLEGVEVYTSTAGIPSQFATGTTCGVVAFWTRTGVGGSFRWKRLLAGVPALALIVFGLVISD